MKQMSHILIYKYTYFSNIIDYDRKTYFTRVIPCRGHPNYDYLLQLAYTEEDMIDPSTDIYLYKFEMQEFFLFMQYIQSMKYAIMQYWNDYNRKLRRIQKRFEEIKKPLKIIAYQRILKQYFCYDISQLITTFIL